MRVIRVFVCLVAAITAACAEPRSEVGVDVFSNDTIPARFVVDLKGSTLVMALRSNNFYMRPDKSLVLETPGSLILKEGSGSAMIMTLDTTHRVAVQPIGTPPDSADILGIVGREIRMTRVGDERRMKLELVKK
jgi:hypothetical protein